MTFPGLTEAEDYLRKKLQDFYNQTWVIKDQMTKIGQLKQQALKNNDQPALGKLQLAMDQAKQTMTEQLALEERLRPFADYFGVSYSLGAMPVILAASAIAVASALYLHFQKVSNQKQALDLIAAGMLDPTNAEKILNAPLFTLGSLTGTMFLPLALIAGVYFFFLRGRSA